MAEYAKRGYKVLAGSGTNVTLERKATAFNWFMALALIWLFGVGALVYVLIWWIWGVHKTYRAMLSIGPQGELQEGGDYLAIYDRDRLDARRKRGLGFGWFLAVLGAFGVLIAVVGMFTGNDTVANNIMYGLVTFVIIGVVPGVGALLLLMRAARDKQALSAAPGWQGTRPT